MSRNKNEPLNIVRVFNSHNKEINSVTSVLSKLFRIVAADLGIRYTDYNRMVNQWLDDPLYGVQNDTKRRSTVRGNLNKEIVRPEMSFRTFLKALCACTGTESVKISLSLKRKGSKMTTDHEITIPNLPMLVAQFLHDGPDRTGKVLTKQTMKAGDKAVSFLIEKGIDSIANEMEQITNAAVITTTKRGPVYHIDKDADDGC